MTRFCGIGTRFLHLCGSKRAELEKRLVPDEITALYVDAPNDGVGSK